MSRMRTVATALALAGGVYCLGAGTAQASNMGFKLERSFDLIRNATTGRPQQNIYWLSQPLFNGLGDVGVSDANGLNGCCVGFGTCAATGDGRIESIDAVCEYWTAKSDLPTAGAFQWTYYDRETCLKRSYTGAVAGGRMVFSGPSLALDREVGYQIVIGTNTAGTASPVNRAIVVGSHDPGFAGRTIRPGATCTQQIQQDLLNLPYHTMYRTSDEILCGLEGTDWTPDVNGNPATCPNGLFDGARSLQVEWFENNSGASLPRGRTVSFVGTRLLFNGAEFDLVPGEAYRLSLNAAQTPKTWLSPHF